MEEENGIRVLVIRPDQNPQVEAVPNELKALQELVGGPIEVVPLDRNTLLICNEEGKLLGLPPNRAVGRDIIAGTFFLCGQGYEDFASLTEKQAVEWTRTFRHSFNMSLEQAAGQQIDM